MIFSVFNGKDARSRGVSSASFSKNYRCGIRVKTFCLSTPPFLPIVRLNVGQPQTKRTGKFLPVRFVLTLMKGDSNGLGVGLQTIQ